MAGTFFSSILLVLLLTAPPVFADDPPIVWSEIPEIDLKMTVCSLDSNAGAMVLCDYGEAAINSDLGIEFKRHTRIKIFTPAGYEWGTRIITLYTKDHYEKLEDLEGATYVLDASGHMQTTELEDNAIFEEEVDASHLRYRFTLPALAPGCIVEFRYVINQRYWFSMPTWTFHTPLPVYWSEYRVIAPNVLAYARVVRSYEPFFVNEITEVTRHIRDGETTAYLGTSLAHCNQYRWVQRNILPLREESFVTTLDDYMSQVRMQLAEYAHRYGGGSEKVLRTWSALVKDLTEDKEFGKMLNSTRTTERLTQKLIAGKTTPLDVMKAVYDYVRSNVVWNGKHRWWGEGDVDDIVDAKKGSSGEINLLLINMLRIAGVDAQPILVSTRANGKTVEDYPLLEQFNSTAVRAKGNGTDYILDATDPLRNIDLLPLSLLNVRGFVVSPPEGAWITISSPRRYVHRALANITVDTLGSIHGTLESSDEEYASLFRRKSLRDKKIVDFAAEVFDAHKTGLLLDSVRITGKDTMDGSLRIESLVTGNGYAQVAGDFLYVNPTVIDRETTNPFKMKERNYPVDMSFLRSELSVANVTIPEGYEVKEKPPTVSFGVAGDALTFTRVGSVEGRTVQFVSRFTVRTPIFQPAMYKSLKQLYDQMVAAQAVPLVLQKKPPTPKPVAPTAVPAKARKKK